MMTLAIVIFGTINALVFLPALLGLVGSSKEADDLRTSAADSAHRLAEADREKSEPDNVMAGGEHFNGSDEPVASATV